MAQSLTNTNVPLDRPVSSPGQRADRLFLNGTRLFALSAVAAILGIAVMLLLASRQNIAHSGLHFLTGTVWDAVPPDADKKIGNIFGVLPFVYGTVVTSILALLIAVPLGIGAAIFLAEIAPRWIATPVSFLVELLAAVPSIVYGFWAAQYLVPRLQSGVETWLSHNFGQIPFFAETGDGGTGNNLFAAGVILSLMVLPFITAVSRDVLKTVPTSQREAAYGMGATKWEAIRGVILKYASGGIIGAVMLGLGRAIGETMAVTIVIGNNNTFPKLSDVSTFSLFRPANTMTSILAAQYPSPETALHTSALTEVAFLLFLITVIVNGLARFLVWITAAKASGQSSEFGERAKEIATVGSRYLMLGTVALVFLIQITLDVKLRGIRGLFGGASLIGIGVLALVLFNKIAPGKPYFSGWRKFANAVGLATCMACAALACLALAALLFFVTTRGISSINGQFFRLPRMDDSGGVLHAIAGTALLVLMAGTMGIPFGVLGGIYLSEFGGSKLGWWTRFCADLLNGVPSIVLGIFAYTVVFVVTKWAGISAGFALGVMMIPTVMRTTEELLKLVPNSLREGSMALGASHAYTVWKVVLPTARSGVVTGVLLAVARIAGETAPLLMVGCNSQLWNLDPRKPMASLPMQIYSLRDQLGTKAYEQLWGVSLTLIVLALTFSLIARYFTRDKMKMTA